jgi:Chaperone of endosialidase
MPATIKIKNSSTASAVPTSSDLVQGELAVNVTDRRLFTENASGTVVELGTNPTILTMGAAGSASAPVITRTGDTNTGIFFPAADTIAFAEGGTETMRLDSSGNLGLGVTPGTWNSVLRALEIGGTTGSILNFKGSSSVSGAITFNARNDGSNWVYQNSTHAAKFDYNYDSGGAFTWQRAASGTAGNAITFTQAMTLDASGNLLVGLTSSSSRLHIDGGDANVSRTSGNSRLLVTATGVANTAVGFNNSGSTTTGMANNVGYVNVLQAYPLVFGTDSTERARIDSSGNLLVGNTTVPGGGAAATGAALGQSGYISVQRTAATPCFFGRSNDGEIMALYSGTTQRGQVSISGATTTYGSFSDYRLKENIVPLTGAVAKVMALKPSTFNFIEFPEQTINGFIAHEVAEVEPIAVTGQKDAVDEEGNQLYQSVDPAKLVPLLTAAFQELKAEFDAYKASHP